MNADDANYMIYAFVLRKSAAYKSYFIKQPDTKSFPGCKQLL
jgi:hypothetical protein